MEKKSQKAWRPEACVAQKRNKVWLGMVAHTCNPHTLGVWGGWTTRSRDWDHPGQHGETLSLLKLQKISWAWWHVPVIPATQEAEAGELPEPRRWTLRWAEIAPFHSSLGNKSETPSQKKKKEFFKIHKYLPSKVNAKNNKVFFNQSRRNSSKNQPNSMSS